MIKLLRLRMVWERLAREDPFWAVLATPEKTGNRWKTDEFFRTGVVEIDASLNRLEQLAPGIPRRRSLDFGCGVGRLTLALGRHFQEVVGIDVAARMIELAERHNSMPDRVSFIHNPQADLRRFDSNHFDLIFSLITLQHIPPDLIEGYVREFVRVAGPDGAIYFQVPTPMPASGAASKRWTFYPPSIWKRAVRWFKRTTGIGDTMHMYSLPEARVRTLLMESGAELLATIPHPTGNEYRSVIYVARKQRAISDQATRHLVS